MQPYWQEFEHPPVQPVHPDEQPPAHPPEHPPEQALPQYPEHAPRQLVQPLEQLPEHPPEHPPEQLLEQLLPHPEHPPLHEPEQPVHDEAQLPLQPPIQLYMVHPVAASRSVPQTGKLIMVNKPITGRVLLAASLKNERLDCNSLS